MNNCTASTNTHLDELRQRVRKFVDQVAIPLENQAIERDIDKLDEVTLSLRTQARQSGIYAPQLPKEWGGLGLSWADCAVIFEEAARGLLGPLALNCAAPDQPNMWLLLELGTPQQLERYLGPLATGQKRACFAMTEPAPGAGSDPNMLTTHAERTDGGWLLSGHKTFISGGVKSDFAIVPAQTNEGVTLFIIDTDVPGFEVVRDVGMVTSYQIGGHAEIQLRDCFIDDAQVLGQIGAGFQHAQQRLEPARLAHCMRFIGRASRALELAQEYVSTRHSFGQLLSETQQIQAMVADSHIDLHASRLMTQHCAQRLDAGVSIRHESAMTKVFVSEAIGRVTDRAVQMMGALGVSDDTPVSAIWREARPFRIYDGANELHRAMLARRVFYRQLHP
ncbi:acyl-CoA dehydrogenase family protein [Alcaligenes endophyticus]|uniref:Acyl-CoA/acyl-ACP dehydrogenase n=1 Tax=Alcaligenes endophyticus TaxID=1929088 RepID=A0ABT8EJ26_9BURK|nr:acyl-CoA dehydrogenase family protein [Alcaligenes endophyticus]MCX5591614.1 acyl-CoA/acyl-ACP dehydrogenase [Alcaligenes endophyticus]MDN4121291.1 acyl-CoA/acyl-ACP dehydrogenase [Alcaligenes endophyticus]